MSGDRADDAAVWFRVDGTTPPVLALDTTAGGSGASAELDDTTLIVIIVVFAGACVLFVALMIVVWCRKNPDTEQTVASEQNSHISNISNISSSSSSNSSVSSSTRGSSSSNHQHANDESVAGAAIDAAGGYGAAPAEVPSEPPSLREPKAVRVASREHAVVRRESHRWVIDADEVRVLKQIGEGAFGIVMKGEWRDAPVAIKQAHAHSKESDLADFRMECKRMSQLQPHAHCVQFYGVTELSGALAVVIEFCDGGALADALYGAAPLKWRTASLLRVARGAAAGVNHLHSQAFVHRDIAARNVLLHGSKRTAKLTDFGMLREDDGEEENVTRNAVGPLKWMSPESMRERKYSTQSDVFSFGVLLWEIFAQQAPWPGLSGLQAAHKVMGGERMEPPVGMPAALQPLLARSWHTKPKRRPTMRAVLDAIVACQADVVDGDDAASNSTGSTGSSSSSSSSSSTRRRRAAKKAKKTKKRAKRTAQDAAGDLATTPVYDSTPPLDEYSQAGPPSLAEYSQAGAPSGQYAAPPTKSGAANKNAADDYTAAPPAWVGDKAVTADYTAAPPEWTADDGTPQSGGYAAAPPAWATDAATESGSSE